MAIQATGSLLGKIWYYYGDDGARALGEAWKTARKSKSVFSFKQAIGDCYTKHVNDAAKAAATGAKAGIFKRTLGCLWKFAGPAMMIVPELITAFQEIQNGGGIGGALKSIGKGLITSSGFPIAGFILAALGIGAGPLGLVGMAAGIGMSMLTGALSNKIFSPTRTELLAQQQQMQQGNQMPSDSTVAGVDLNKIDRKIQATDDWLRNFDINSNSCIIGAKNPSYSDSSRRMFIC